METGIATAQKAADTIISDGPMGAIAVLLAIAFMALLIWHFKEMRRLNTDLLESERTHGKDALIMQGSVSAALATVQQAINIITTNKGR